MKCLIGSTLPPFKATAARYDYASWLENAEQVRELAEAEGHEVEFFAALEIDGRGIDVHKETMARLDALGGEWWTFSINDGSTEITSVNRLVRITTGRNLIIEKALRDDYDACLFLDSDVTPAPDIVPRLWEVDHPIVGSVIPTYCLGQSAPTLPGYPEGWDVREHWNTAGALMFRREALRRVRWAHCLAEGHSDDPFTQDMAVRLGLGVTRVRHDVVSLHHPGQIEPLENRQHDLVIRP